MYPWVKEQYRAKTECKDSNDIIFKAKTSRLCSFLLFKLQLP